MDNSICLSFIDNNSKGKNEEILLEGQRGQKIESKGIFIKVEDRNDGIESTSTNKDNSMEFYPNIRRSHLGNSGDIFRRNFLANAYTNWEFTNNNNTVSI